MNRLLREPLLHFALLGVLLFVSYGEIAKRTASPDAIVVSRGQVANLAAIFEGTWQRPPTSQELDRLIQEWIRDEVMYREGVALGIDRGDPVIRNRVRRKMELLGEDAVATKPSQAELQAWLDAHPADYTTASEYSFTQIFVDPSRHGAAMQQEIDGALELLNRNGTTQTASGLGDATLLPSTMQNVSAFDVERTFGKQFASALAEITPGAWLGPVRSSYGLHLVSVSTRTEAHVATLADAREAVTRDWQASRMRESIESYYRALLRRYRVVVEQRDPATTAGGSLADRR